MGTRFVRFTPTLPGLLLACCVLGGCAPQLPAATLSPRAPGEDALIYDGFGPRPPRRSYAGNFPALPDDPKNPIGKPALQVLEAGQKQLPIVDIIRASPTLSLREVESAAANDKLTNFGEQPGSTFLGSIGEAFMSHQIHQGWTVKSMPTVTPQPGKLVLPAALSGEYPDLMVTEPGMCLLELGIMDVKLEVTFPDTIDPGTGGRAMKINFGPNIIVSYWEITTSTRFDFIKKRAERVAKWATKLGGFIYPSRSCKCGQTTVQAAVLAIDRGAYFNLSDTERTEIVNIATGADGFIMLIRDLTTTSLQHANTLATQLKPVSRP